MGKVVLVITNDPKKKAKMIEALRKLKGDKEYPTVLDFKTFAEVASTSEPLKPELYWGYGN